MRRLTAELDAHRDLIARVEDDRDRLATASEEHARAHEALRRQLVDADAGLGHLTAELEAQREFAARTQRDRDRFGAALVRTEQELAREQLARAADEGEASAEINELRAGLAAERDGVKRVQSTVSWRVTKPLRLVRGRLGRDRDR